jgi:GNAT superfamily N-acetyltransferase
MIELREVETRGDFKEFLSFPYRLYRNHPYWVPPLYIDEKTTLSPKKNPAFDFCEARMWLVRENGRALGRIAGIRNDKYIEKWGNRYLRFGWLDLVDRDDVADLLFSAVESWAREQGMSAVHGPLGFTDLDREGMLIEGFDERETLPMIYNYPYYPVQLERLRYQKDVDWLQYAITVPDELGSKFGRLKKIVMERNKLRILDPKRSKELMPYAAQVFSVMNQAYKELYGVVELNQAQIRYYLKQYFTFVRPEFVKILLDEEDQVAAFAISLPRLTEALQRSEGRILPLGFVHLLRAMHRPEELVFYLIGVKPAYQNKGLNSVLLSELYRECREHGIHTIQTCGELEDNSNIVTLMKNFEHRLNKRRRCYIKQL